MDKRRARIVIVNAVRIRFFLGRAGLSFVFGRYALLFYTNAAFILSAVAAFEYRGFIPVAVVSGLLAAVGWHDYMQKKRSVLGNYPLLEIGRAHVRTPVTA